jgi:hypothetical protein
MPGKTREGQETLPNRVNLALYENTHRSGPSVHLALRMGFKNGISTQHIHIPARGF